MKIHEGQLPIITKTSTARVNTGTGEDDFRKIMEQVSLEAEKGEAVAPGGVYGPAGGVQILQHVQSHGESAEFAPHRKELLREIQNTLDLVDFYAVKLGDSSMPADGLTSLVDHLEERLEHMKDMESNPDLPTTLKSVLSDMLVTVGTEIAKFKRGDYL